MKKEVISENKFVELTYKIINQSNGNIISQVETPLGYVHGDNSPLFEQVMLALEGKSVGDHIEVAIDCHDIFGSRDEALTFTDDIANVPQQYQQIGAKITMENDKGELKEFFVTKIEDGQLTVDGNNLLCGKKIIFNLEILLVRDATEDEMVAGGTTEPDIGDII